jgi:hypothetical protein
MDFPLAMTVTAGGSNRQAAQSGICAELPLAQGPFEGSVLPTASDIAMPCISWCMPVSTATGAFIDAHVGQPAHADMAL